MFSKRAIVSDGQKLIRQHVKELTHVFEQYFAEDKAIQLDTVLLAFTTDTLYHYAFDKESGFMSDNKAARSWRNAMVSVAAVTPFVKQFPWILKLVRALPHAALLYLLPDVSRLLGVHRVRLDMFLSYILYHCFISI